MNENFGEDNPLVLAEKCRVKKFEIVIPKIATIAEP